MAGDRADGVSGRAIGDYAMLSDCHSAALVSLAGSVDWLCLPRFDSPSIFGRLLDADAGHWSIRPAAAAEATRRYRKGTLVLETRFATERGTAVLEDALAVGADERGHQLGSGSPHALLRRVRGLDGRLAFDLEYSPRPEYGLVQPLLTSVEGGIAGRGGAAVLMLSSPLALDVSGTTARARFAVEAGESVAFALQHRASWEAAPERWRPAEIARRLGETARAWKSWSAIHQGYQGPWRDLVHHSGRVLQGLTYYPTGAIIAAPTTSLPETVGGHRNWDYRYCWIRDASLTLDALWVAACPDEAGRFFDFLTGAALAQMRERTDLQIVFGVGGEHDLGERTLPRLAGWRASRPVRIGNAAWSQRQLDVYGELLGAVARLREQLAGLDDVSREFLADAADAAAERWRRPDHGIWELRTEPRHYVYSKLMCWVALDRAIAVAELLRAEERVPRWCAEREAIRRAILDRGWNPDVGAFTQAFDGGALDASNLVMPIVGFLPHDDPRMRATIEAIADRLATARGLVRRYRAPDGLEGEEGAFLLCSFWLVEALARLGETDRARATFEAAIARANDVGLLSEQADPATGESLGNFPQAFSHIGLINAAWAISEAEAEGGGLGRARA